MRVALAPDSAVNSATSLPSYAENTSAFLFVPQPANRSSLIATDVTVSPRSRTSFEAPSHVLAAAGRTKLDAVGRVLRLRVSALKMPPLVLLIFPERRSHVFCRVNALGHAGAGALSPPDELLLHELLRLRGASRSPASASTEEILARRGSGDQEPGSVRVASCEVTPTIRHDFWSCRSKGMHRICAKLPDQDKLDLPLVVDTRDHRKP
jgi:hypothetical protein